MKQRNGIELSRERRGEMISDIRSYFKREREEEIGQLAAGMVLDFIVKELAPEFYNQGVEDSYRYLTDRVEDMRSLML